MPRSLFNIPYRCVGRQRVEKIGLQDVSTDRFRPKGDCAKGLKEKETLVASLYLPHRDAYNRLYNLGTFPIDRKTRSGHDKQSGLVFAMFPRAPILALISATGRIQQGRVKRTRPCDKLIILTNSWEDTWHPTIRIRLSAIWQTMRRWCHSSGDVCRIA